MLTFKEGMENELAKYYKKDDANPQLRSGLKIKTEDKTLTYESCVGSVYTVNPRCTIKSIDYAEGTLVLYVADVEKKQIIWQSVLNGIIDQDAIRNNKNIRKTIQMMFKQFPYSKD